MSENPKIENEGARSPAQEPNPAHGSDEAEARALLQAIHAGIGQAHEPPPESAQPAAEAGATSGGWRTAPWPMAALVLFMAAAASFAGIALYLSSRRAAVQTAAIEKVGQSLVRVEQQIALQSSAGAAAATEARKSREPAATDLLEAANAHYREGRFPDAVLAFRAAEAADTGGQLSDEARYRYGASLLKTGDSNGALREFQAVVTGFPGSPCFAASAMETARLLMEQKNYPRARQTLYLLLAARDRLGAADKDYVERAGFLVGRCLECEAASLEAAQSATLPVARFGPAAPARAKSDSPDASEGK